MISFEKIRGQVLMLSNGRSLGTESVMYEWLL